MADVEAENIAVGLTEAQREFVRACPDKWLDEYSEPRWPNIHMRADLGDLGKMRPGAVFNHAWRLTPLGLRVRSILTAQGQKP